MLLLDCDPLGFILKEIPLKNFACCQDEHTSVPTEKAGTYCIGLHIISILDNLANLHVLCIPESHLAIDRHCDHLALVVIKVKPRHLRLVCIVHSLE